MAEVVDEFPVKRPGDSWKYPWGLWFDGRKWKLIQGVDFKGETRKIAMSAYHAARRLGVVIAVQREEGCVYVQKTADRRPAAKLKSVTG